MTTPERITRIIERMDPVDREVLEQHLNSLDEGFKRQANAARMGMDAAKRSGSAALAQAEKLHAECNPAAVESERAANELLTNENQRLTQERDELATQCENLATAAAMAVGALPDKSPIAAVCVAAVRKYNHTGGPDFQQTFEASLAEVRAQAIEQFAEQWDFERGGDGEFAVFACKYADRIRKEAP